MARLVAGDVVVVPFPFTDLANGLRIAEINGTAGRLQDAKLQVIRERVCIFVSARGGDFS